MYKNDFIQRSLDLQWDSTSVRTDALSDVSIELGEPIKFLRLIKIYLSETCSWVSLGKYLCQECLFIMVSNEKILFPTSLYMALS